MSIVFVTLTRPYTVQQYTQQSRMRYVSMTMCVRVWRGACLGDVEFISVESWNGM